MFSNILKENALTFAWEPIKVQVHMLSLFVILKIFMDILLTNLFRSTRGDILDSVLCNHDFYKYA